MIRSANTATPPLRCSLHVTRETERTYLLTCSCGLKRTYADRPAASTAAIQHGDESGHGYSVTNR